ncbi:unnamed protein product, partial [marine sediment metagenome]
HSQLPLPLNPNPAQLLTFMMEDPHTISRAIHLIFVSINNNLFIFFAF